MSHSWYLSRSSRPTLVYFFQASLRFAKRTLNFCIIWPVTAIFGYFVANLRTFRCTFTGLDCVNVYRNWQITRMTCGTLSLKVACVPDFIKCCHMPCFPNPKWTQDSLEALQRDGSRTSAWPVIVALPIASGQSLVSGLVIQLVGQPVGNNWAVFALRDRTKRGLARHRSGKSGRSKLCHNRTSGVTWICSDTK